MKVLPVFIATLGFFTAKPVEDRFNQSEYTFATQENVLE